MKTNHNVVITFKDCQTHESHPSESKSKEDELALLYLFQKYRYKVPNGHEKGTFLDRNLETNRGRWRRSANGTNIVEGWH